jgi:hypothetical protein
MRYRNLSLIIILFTCLPKVWAAQNTTEAQWHGFVAQGMIDVSHSNFVDDQQGLSFKLTELGINGSYQLTSTVRLAGQAVYLNGGNRYAEGARLDYLLLDWALFNSDHWQFNAYLGRFKNSHWLYASIRDIPFARPSIVLPQSIYFDSFRDIAMGGDGAALRISYSDDGVGEFDFNLSSGVSSISTKQQNVILSTAALGVVQQDFDTQASFYWRPYSSAWRFGLSLLDSNFNYHASAHADAYANGLFAFQYYTLNAIYEGEHWELSTEIHHQRFVTTGFYAQDHAQTNIGQGWYVQARYKLNSEITLLMRGEKFYLNKDDKQGAKLEQQSAGAIPSYFAYQNDISLGVAYDVAQRVRVQFEQHWVQGTGRLTPIMMPDPQINGRAYWQFWALQLMYWF